MAGKRQHALVVAFRQQRKQLGRQTCPRRHFPPASPGVFDRALSLTEYSGTLKPKTSLEITAFARIIERKTHGYLGAAPAAIGLCQWRRLRGVLRTFVGISPIVSV